MAAITIVLFFLLTRSATTLEKMEFPILVVPLIIAAVLTLTLVLGELISTEGTKPLRTITVVILVVAITWAGLLAFFYDYRAHYHQRLASYLTDLQIANLLAADSLFISHPYLTPSIVGGNHIRIAFPGVDKAKDLSRLVTYHLKKGRRVFSILPPRLWRDLEFRILKACVVKPELTLSNGVVFGEISLKPSSQ